jgi:hypothetical protein
MHQNTDTTQQQSQSAMLTRSSQQVSHKLGEMADSSLGFQKTIADLPRHATQTVSSEDRSTREFRIENDTPQPISS